MTCVRTLAKAAPVRHMPSITRCSAFVFFIMVYRHIEHWVSQPALPAKQQFDEACTFAAARPREPRLNRAGNRLDSGLPHDGADRVHKNTRCGQG